MKTALLQIDWQQAFRDPSLGELSHGLAEKNAEKILLSCRSNQIPVYHVQHASTNPDSLLHPDKVGFSLIQELKPVKGEKLFVKNVNSAFIGTTLHETLQNDEITQLIVTGMTTNHCVSTSVRMAGNFGYDVLLVSDATDCFGISSMDGDWISANEVHRVNLASLHEEFCQVLPTSNLLSSTFMFL